NRPKRAAPSAPRRPPHEIAAAELERLRGRRLVEHGAFKEYYSALSDIVRRYLEDRFKLRAPEMTTEEFLLATARDGRLMPAHRAVAPAGAARRRIVLAVLRLVALVLLAVALARPQAGTAATKVHREGVDVVLAVDVSGSMLSEDFTLGSGRASRLDAVKAVV